MTAEPPIPVPPPLDWPGSRPADYCRCGRPKPCRCKKAATAVAVARNRGTSTVTEPTLGGLS